VVGAAVWYLFLRATPPQIVAVAPAQAETGQTVSVTGRNFASGAGGNTVLFGGKPAQVTSASASELKVVVPVGVKAQVPVVVQTTDGRSSPFLVSVVAVPTVTGLVPDVAMPGQSIVIRGDSLSGSRLSVEFGGMAAASVEPAPEGIRATVPMLGLPEGAKTPVIVKVGTSATRPVDLTIGRLPLITSVAPERGSIGDRVTLEGRGFGPGPLANTVTFAGQPALVLTASPTKLSVVAPAPPTGDAQPDVAVVVTVGGQASSPKTFQIVHANTSGFVPRFFASPVAESPADDLVFVSTEIGPVLLLGGKAGAASTAERAVATADALNALVAGAASRPLAFELRERPEPAVAVVGEVRPLLVPTPEDAQAYSRNWETGRGAGRRVTTASLARHWAALLQDYFGLFLYRQRPLKMVALSPRGRVLTEIYGEANRRSPGGTNVPTSLVFPTTESMARRLRELALVVSGEGGQAAVAMEGRWEGTVEDPDLGTRRFQIELRAEGGRLSGTITTWRGSIALVAPLRNIGFDRGSVRFTADLQGAANEFKGTLEGNTVTGTVTRPGKAAPFTLQFVE
jgi:hypothetical protein